MKYRIQSSRAELIKRLGREKKGVNLQLSENKTIRLISLIRVPGRKKYLRLKTS